MARLVELESYTTRVKKGGEVSSNSGRLTVLENFEMKFIPRRWYWLDNVPPGETRGGHRHLTTKHLLVCPTGSCEVTINNGKDQTGVIFKLDSPNRGLYLEPGDWHIMHSFSTGTALLVFASTNYDPNDYVYEPYPQTENNV